MNVLSYRLVKSYVQELADSIPELDTPCEEFTYRHAPGFVEEQKGMGKVTHPEEVLLTAKVGKMRIEIKVIHYSNQEGGAL